MSRVKLLVIAALVLGGGALIATGGGAPSPAGAVAPVAASDPTRFSATWWDSPEAVCPPGTSLRGGPPPDGREIWCERADGTRDGQNIGWWPTGRKAYARRYREGRLDGAWSEWREDGRPQATGFYRAGQRRGRWVKWTELGDAKVTEYGDGD